MSTAPFQTGPETTYEPQNQSISQNKLPQEAQEDIAAKSSNDNGPSGAEPSKIAEKVTTNRAEGLGENEKFRNPEMQAK
jgi:hypothetical protein